MAMCFSCFYTYKWPGKSLEANKKILGILWYFYLVFLDHWTKFLTQKPHIYILLVVFQTFSRSFICACIWQEKTHCHYTFLFLMIIYFIVYCITFPRVILHCYHPGVWCLHNPRVPPDVSGNCHFLTFYCHRPVVGGNYGLLCWFSILLETCKFWLMNIFLALVVGPSAYSGIYIGVWSYSALLTGNFSPFDQQHVFIMIFGLIPISITSFDLKSWFSSAGATVYFTQPSLRSTLTHLFFKKSKFPAAWMLLLCSANLHPFMICFLFSHFWDASPSPKLFHKVLISRSLPLHILAIGSTVAVHACVAPILQQFRSSFILWMTTNPCSKYELVHFCFVPIIWDPLPKKNQLQTSYFMKKWGGV